MAAITIFVPDGDTCKGCEFKGHSCYEYAYQCYEEYDTCEIFKCKIENNVKCNACRTITKLNGERKENDCC